MTLPVSQCDRPLGKEGGSTAVTCLLAFLLCYVRITYLLTLLTYLLSYFKWEKGTLVKKDFLLTRRVTISQ